MIRTALAMGLALVACGDPHEQRVRLVMEGGAGREEALMELLLGKGEVLPAVLPRLTDPAQPLRGRVDLVDLAWKLYVRESDPRILPALLALIDDPEPELRRVSARALAQIGREELVHPLLDQLEREVRGDVQLEILRAVELLDEWGVDRTWNLKIRGGNAFSPGERARFIAALQKIRRGAGADSLRYVAEEFLEKIAGQLAAEAEELVVRADLDGALALYDRAREITPDGKHLHMSLGKFHYFNGDRAKGIEVLAAHGMALQVPRIEAAPVVDGLLDEAVWARATRLDSFYQNVMLMRAVPAEGRSELYLYYSADAIYLGLKAHEETTEGLVADHRQRDSQVWRDDGAEFYFDTDMDQRSYWGIISNCIGAILDVEQSQKEGQLTSNDWNGDFQLATRIEPTYWSLELALPFAEVEAAGTGPGDVWGFNATRVRIGIGAEHGQFVPTHGRSLRPRLFGLLVFE